jgi:hypothetical protein
MPDFILSYNVAPQTFQRIIRLNLAPQALGEAALIVAIGLFCAGTCLRLGSRTFASTAHRGYYVAIIGAAGQIRVEVRCRSGNLNRRYRGIRSGAGPAVNVVLRNTRGRRLGPP